MEKSQKHLVIVAGEASGDMHAAHLVDAIKTIDTNVRFSGVGGARMQTSGVELYTNLADLAVIGFGEVLKNFGEIRRVFNLVLKKIKETKPAAVILVDYPGFNMRLAKKLKAMNVKVIYYISPQVWAWKKNRIKLIKRYTDKMLVFFPFEKDFYQKYGLEVTFIGHPLLDTIKIKIPREQFLASKGLPIYKLTIGILPGSRQTEIKRILPIMLKAAEIVYREFPRTQFLLVRAPTISENVLKNYLRTTDFPVSVASEESYSAINACDICMVASGTATLETAILEKPMVVIYKTSFLTWLLGRLFIRIPYIGLVNVVAGKKIVPECIQFDATPQKIARELKSIFTNELRVADIKSELETVKESLGSPGAASRAAQEILRII